MGLLSAERLAQVLEECHDRFCNGRGRLIGVNLNEQTVASIVMNQRLGFSPENLKTGLEDCNAIVTSCLQLRAIPVASSGSLRGHGLKVVNGLAKRADSPVNDSLGDAPGIHGHADHREQRTVAMGAEIRIQPLSLPNGAGKAVENKACGGIGKAKSVGDHLGHQGIRNQAPHLHDAFGLDPQGAARGYIRAEDFSSGYGWNSPELRQRLCLRAFADARCAQQEQRPRPAHVHRGVIGPDRKGSEAFARFSKFRQKSLCLDARFTQFHHVLFTGSYSGDHSYCRDGLQRVQANRSDSDTCTGRTMEPMHRRRSQDNQHQDLPGSPQFAAHEPKAERILSEVIPELL